MARSLFIIWLRSMNATLQQIRRHLCRRISLLQRRRLGGRATDSSFERIRPWDSMWKGYGSTLCDRTKRYVKTLTGCAVSHAHGLRFNGPTSFIGHPYISHLTLTVPNFLLRITSQQTDVTRVLLLVVCFVCYDTFCSGRRFLHVLVFLGAPVEAAKEGNQTEAFIVPTIFFCGASLFWNHDRDSAVTFLVHCEVEFCV